VEEVDLKNRMKKKYPYNRTNTPFEKLKSIPGIEHYLPQDVSLDKTQKYADQMSDNNIAERMVKARSDLFKRAQRFS
jgi:hypothetical protein